MVWSFPVSLIKPIFITSNCISLFPRLIFNMTLGVFNISALRTFAAEVRVLTHATVQWLPLVDSRQTATLKSLKIHPEASKSSSADYLMN